MVSHLVLIPPFFILATLYLTKNLNLAFTLGIISSSLVAARGSILNAASLLLNNLFTQISDIHYFYMYGFLIIIGILIMLLNQSGGADAFAESITKKIKSARSVESSSLAISSLLFIDDYLSNLTVGCVLKPLTDLFKIPRAKLAYLVHSMSGPLVILVPISSWVAMIIGQLDNAGINQHAASSRVFADPFFIYLSTLPFIFYSLFTIVSVIIIVQKKISFGPMHIHEIIAKKTGNLWGGKTAIGQHCAQACERSSRPLDLILPLILLMITIIMGILLSGGYWMFGGGNSLIQSFKSNTNSFFVFFFSSLITVAASFVFALMRNTMSIGEVPYIIKSGFNLMIGAIITLFFASLFGLFLKNDLALGTYFADAVSSTLPHFAIPAIVFFISSLIAILTGTSWGTIALMLPVCVQLLCSLTQTCSGSASDIPLLFPTLGAIFSGAVCGDHISPLSETTIMAATSTGSYPMDHTITQIFYTFPAIIVTFGSFLLVGFLIPHYGITVSLIVSLVLGMISLLTTLSLANKNR